MVEIDEAWIQLDEAETEARLINKEFIQFKHDVKIKMGHLRIEARVAELVALALFLCLVLR